jgi:16S rRNA (cytidine1402-2'-O)-methyltransferase
MSGGVLYVVATPIGNLEDLSPRALRVLGEVDLIAAEDTRRTRALLTHHGLRRPLASYYDAVERERAPALARKLQDGARVALVSDAGTPGLNDPGYHLVRAALEAGVPVVPIPGPSAVTALLSVAGIPCERFAFEGFLPSRAGPRRRRLEALRDDPRALVFLEAGRRLPGFLDAAAAALGDRQAVVGRELTKRHEEILRGRLSEIAGTLAARDLVRGEVTVLVAGCAEPPPAAGTGADLDERIRALRAEGSSLRDLAATLALEFGLSKRGVYQRALALAAADPHQSSR